MKLNIKVNPKKNPNLNNQEGLNQTSSQKPKIQVQPLKRGNSKTPQDQVINRPMPTYGDGVLDQLEGLVDLNDPITTKNSMKSITGNA